MKNIILPIILYIDPGTGAMLFSVLMGIISVLFFAIKGAFVKLKFMISGGKVEMSVDKIPLVIFAESKRYWNVFGSICDELESRKLHCEYWTTSEDDPVFTKTYKYVIAQYIGEGNKAFAKLNLMNAKACLATTPGLDVYQWKRSKNCDKYIHVFHNVAEPALYRMFGIDYYDIIFAMGNAEEEYIRRLELLRNLPKKDIIVVGSTYMDDLLKKKATRGERKAGNSLTILLAPSWGETSITNKYGETLLDELIKTGYKVIFRPHPQSFISDKELMDRLEKKYPNTGSFTWDKNPDNFNSLYEADVLISDFSGIIYDFAFCFEKPVLYANSSFDASVYDAWWLDGDAWSIKNLPIVGKELNEQDFSKIRTIIANLSDDYAIKRKRDELKSKAWEHQCESSKLIADYLVTIAQ